MSPERLAGTAIEEAFEAHLERQAIQMETVEAKNAGTPWEEQTQEWRAIFTGVLNRPHAGLDKAIADRDKRWGNDGEIQAESNPIPHVFRKINP